MKPSNTDTQEIERAIASHEQAADLAALQSMAGPTEPTEGAGLQAQAEPPSGPSVESLQLAVMLVGIVRPLAAFAVPVLRTAPDELWQPIPQGVAGVIDHYDIAGQINNPWVVLLMACAPLAAYAAMEKAKEPPKAKPEEKKLEIEGFEFKAGPVPQQPPSKAVTFGAPVPAEA